MKRRLQRHALARLSKAADEGFTLIEAVVSLLILAIVATVSAKFLISSWQSNSDARSRIVAANLAQRELEIVRAQFQSPTLGPTTLPLGQVVDWSPLPGGSQGSPLVVNNKSFTVTRTTQWESQGASSGPCDGGSSGQLAYLRVSVKVTWPNMGHTTPVTSATLLTPPLGTYNAGTGHIKAKVSDQMGAPQSGTPVTVTNSSGGTVASQQTADDGCAFFAFLNPGTYTVTASRTGYVDMSWNSSSSVQVTVVANAAVSAPLSFAQAATTNFTFDASYAGYAPASGTALTVYNGLLTNTTHTKSFSNAAPSKSLVTWPYTDGLIAWSGDCTDADPGVTATPAGDRPDPITTVPGQTGSGVVTGAALSVNVSTATAPVSGATVVAVHATTGCPSTTTDPVSGGTVGEVLTLPTTTDSTGTAKVLLPYGNWTLKVKTKTPATSWPTVALRSDGTYPASISVVVQ